MTLALCHALEFACNGYFAKRYNIDKFRRSKCLHLNQETLKLAQVGVGAISNGTPGH